MATIAPAAAVATDVDGIMFLVDRSVHPFNDWLCDGFSTSLRDP